MPPSFLPSSNGSPASEIEDLRARLAKAESRCAQAERKLSDAQRTIAAMRSRYSGKSAETISECGPHSTEEKLRASEEKFAKAFAINPAAIAISRMTDGEFLEVNATFEKIFGRKREEIIGTYANQFYPTLEDRIRVVQHLRGAGSFYALEQTMLRASGEPFVALMSAARECRRLTGQCFG